MLREMRHTAGGGCRRQVWRRKTSRGEEDASGGGRHIGRRKMHWKAEEASEAEAEFEMERRGGRGFPLQTPQRLKHRSYYFITTIQLCRHILGCLLVSFITLL